MRICVGVMMLVLASGAAAEPLRLSNLGAATTRAAISDQLRNCQANQAVPGQTVCVLNWRELGGVPLVGTMALAQFENDRLRMISMVASGRFQDLSRVLARQYGRPANANSNRVLQDDGRTATIRNTEWTFDDGQIQLGTAEVPGNPQANIVRFMWD
jgi:hypothetical protein